MKAMQNYEFNFFLFVKSKSSYFIFKFHDLKYVSGIIKLNSMIEAAKQNRYYADLFTSFIAQ
ncbi:hypothetical protein ADU37_CDS09830 [Thermococcus sp. 2319x1]|nr:hypothetical protein ADU37_CDS09110 [Thermococcus sp. 2319x1]ALV62682.1 hypothetical protein ADU37_CDS09830 [Thermococcus sp. 2319x1]